MEERRFHTNETVCLCDNAKCQHAEPIRRDISSLCKEDETRLFFTAGALIPPFWLYRYSRSRKYLCLHEYWVDIRLANGDECSEYAVENVVQQQMEYAQEMLDYIDVSFASRSSSKKGYKPPRRPPPSTGWATVNGIRGCYTGIKGC